MGHNTVRAGRTPHLRVVPQAVPQKEASGLGGFPLSQRSPVQGALEELESLVGLERVKELIYEVYAFAEVQKKRQKIGLVSDKVVLHMIFKGNPGTGKTTIARILGRLLRDAGLLEKGHVVEVERADLVGEYIGHTAQKTRDQIRKAQGGILFIDEAYSLSRGGEKDFGKECVDCIVKGMEDNARETVFILAGYPSEMEEFLRSNPGLRSRFPIHLEFPDYSVSELTQIAELMLRKREYRLSPDAVALLEDIVREKKDREIVPSNARMVRNLIEKAIRRQAVRLVRDRAFTRHDLIMLTARELMEASVTLV